MVDSNLLDKFKEITRYGVDQYLLSYSIFTSDNLNLIIGYYSGISEEVPSTSLKFLSNLVRESERLDQVINSNRNAFKTTDFWDLLELIDNIKLTLVTIVNTPKWSRSSTTNGRAISKVETDAILKQRETIERLGGRSLGFSDEHQDWYEVAIRNDLKEEDYTPEGGTPLKVSTSNSKSYEIVSIVDILDRETMKGKDVYKKITWEDDDLKVLSGNEAFLQTIDILVNLKKGDNPEFVADGLNKKLAAGQNINSVAYPILIRQLTETFNGDDTISSWNISSIERVQDGVFLELEIRSKSGDLFNLDTVF